MAHRARRVSPRRIRGLPSSLAEDTPGVTATEIQDAAPRSLSGPVSAPRRAGALPEPYFRMLNEQGGVAGRHIKYIYYDDAFNPARRRGRCAG